MFSTSPIRKRKTLEEGGGTSFSPSNSRGDGGDCDKVRGGRKKPSPKRKLINKKSNLQTIQEAYKE